MEFLKVLIVGIALVILFTVITASQSSPYPEAPVNNLWVMIILAPIILLISIAIGAKRQTSQPRIESNNQSEADKQNVKAKNKIYFIILFILAIIFLSILFINIYFIPQYTTLHFQL